MHVTLDKCRCWIGITYGIIQYLLTYARTSPLVKVSSVLSFEQTSSEAICWRQYRYITYEEEDTKKTKYLQIY